MVAPQEIPARRYSSDRVNLISVRDQDVLHEHTDIYVVFQQEYPRHRRRTGPRSKRWRIGTPVSLLPFPAPKKATPMQTFYRWLARYVKCINPEISEPA